jgi:hypothetical protein
MSKTKAEELAEAVGGDIKWAAALPDGSGAAVMSMPLPSGHWLTSDHANVPPMPWRIGTGRERDAMASNIQAAARYAVRAATLNGSENDFDPDAMVQNFLVGMLGYWTQDGTSSDAWANPEPLPPLRR